MVYETITQVKRTIYVAICPKCGDRTEHTERVAKEKYCSQCNVWVPYEEVSFTGPEIKK